MSREFSLTVNGAKRSTTTGEDRPLLDVLREDFQLTGTKFGCGEGECGACTVLVDGKPTRSCITSISKVDGRQIQTIEGIAPDGNLHAVQQAFLDKQAMQCGYCVPGQILTAVALLRKSPHPSRKQVIESMNGNLCRCCNYPKA